MVTRAFVEVLAPVGKASVRELPLAERLPALDWTVIGFLENSKPNADIFLERIRQGLEEQYEFKDVLWIAKHSASIPATEDRIERLKDQCDLVINAWGD